MINHKNVIFKIRKMFETYMVCCPPNSFKEGEAEKSHLLTTNNKNFYLTFCKAIPILTTQRLFLVGFYKVLEISERESFSMICTIYLNYCYLKFNTLIFSCYLQSGFVNIRNLNVHASLIQIVFV